MSARELLDELILARGYSYSAISALLGRNPAYIQQYIKRGIPVSLKAEDQDTLARFFCQPSDFLRRSPVESSRTVRNDVAANIQAALIGCEAIGLSKASHYLQLALAQVNETNPLPTH